MKKRFYNIILVCILLVSISFCGACAKKSEKTTAFTVEYLAAEGGIVSGEVKQWVAVGSDAKAVLAKANTGYVFVAWSDGITEPIRRDTAIKENKKLTTTFERITFVANYLSQTGGRIVGEINQRVGYGLSTKKVTALSDTGYVFVKWSDGNRHVERQDTFVTKSIVVEAHFNKVTCSVFYYYNKGGSIKGFVKQDLIYGETSSPVTAVVGNGYKFVRWSDGVLTPTRYETNVKENLYLTAYFEKLPSA